MAPDDAIQNRAHLLLGALSDLMTGFALLENLLTRDRIAVLRIDCVCERESGKGCQGEYKRLLHYDFSSMAAGAVLHDSARKAIWLSERLVFVAKDQ